MTDPMTPEELQACRDRAEAATPGPWEMSRRDDVMGGFDYFVEAGPLCVAVAAEDARPTRGMGAKRDAAFIAHARTDVPRLLATIDALKERAERSVAIAATASRNFGAEVARADRAEAALAAVCDVLSAHGCDCECGCDCDGHGDDCDPCLGCRIEAAIKAGECALPTPTVHVPDGETAPPEPRKPLAGWKASERPGEVELSTGLESHNRGHLIARAAPSDGEFIFEIETDDVDGSQHEYQWVRGFDSLEAAQFAAEDALFEIADRINALRGGR